MGGHSIQFLMLAELPFGPGSPGGPGGPGDPGIPCPPVKVDTVWMKLIHKGTHKLFIPCIFFNIFDFLCDLHRMPDLSLSCLVFLAGLVHLNHACDHSLQC